MAGKKLNILITAEKRRTVYSRFARILGKGYNVKEFYVVKNPDKPKSLLKRLIFASKSWKKISKGFNPDKVIICGGSLISIWLIVFLIKLKHSKTEIISFRYDIEYFRKYPTGPFEKFSHLVARKLEKFCIIRSEKIIHKGSEDELKFLPFYSKIKNKPHYLLRDFLDKELIQKYSPNKKLSRKDKKVHLVYGGGWYYDIVPSSDSFFKLYEPLLKNNCHLHLYTKVEQKNKKKIEDFKKKYPNFHYEGFLDRKRLMKEYQKYDFGLNFYGFLKEKKNDVFVKTAFSNKNYDYVAAMLPILTNDEAKAKSDFVVKNKIGFSHKLLDYKSPKVYKKFSDKKTYQNMIKNIRKFIDKSLNNNEFLGFIES